MTGRVGKLNCFGFKLLKKSNLVTYKHQVFVKIFLSFLKTGLRLTACIKSRDLVDVTSIDRFPSSCNLYQVLEPLSHSQL